MHLIITISGFLNYGIVAITSTSSTITWSSLVLLRVIGVFTSDCHDAGHAAKHGTKIALVISRVKSSIEFWKKYLKPPAGIIFKSNYGVLKFIALSIKYQEYYKVHAVQQYY